MALRISSGSTYLLRVVVPDIQGIDAVYKRLISIADLADVSSNFAMEKIKYTTKLPLNYAG
jgi:Lrp/AsnC family transcriptional regulator